MHIRPRRTALVLATTLPAAILVAAPAEAAPPKFFGVCTITGTVIPFTDFDGEGNCTGTLAGQSVTNAPVRATATATGSSVGPLPFLQTGEGELTFLGEEITIEFTFDQTATSLIITGRHTGQAAGEVVPLETSGETRTAQVVATTLSPLS